jgi:hypothetical protein
MNQTTPRGGSSSRVKLEGDPSSCRPANTTSPLRSTDVADTRSVQREHAGDRPLKPLTSEPFNPSTSKGVRGVMSHPKKRL